MCDPIKSEFECRVSLRDNTFANNEADRKGGALRYENKNFIRTRLVNDVTNFSSLFYSRSL